MSGYTPGPWRSDPNSVTGSVWAGNEFVASVYPNAPTDASVFDEWPRLGELRANARLIAAAPELLEALQPFARYLEVLQEMGGNTPKTGPYMAVSSSIAGDAEITVEDMIAARAAIRKATEAAS